MEPATERFKSMFYINRRIFQAKEEVDLITRKMSSEEYRSLSYLLCSFLHSCVTSYFLGPNILLKFLLSKTLNLLSSLNMSNQVSHPYKTTGKVVVLHILILIFLDRKMEDKRFCTEWQQAFLTSICS